MAMRVILHYDRYTKIGHMPGTAVYDLKTEEAECNTSYYNVCIFIYKILNNMLSIVIRNKIEIIGSDSKKQIR